MEAAWLAARGKGVLVGVADTGLAADCPPLRGRVAECRAFGKERPRHGTHICSTIALCAPECRLAVATGAMESPAALAAALRWLAALRPQVVNLSLAVREPDAGVAAAIAALAETGALLLCAADAVYPWLGGLAGVENAAGFPQAFHAWFPGGTGLMRGASVACALASGQAALALSAEPRLSAAGFLARADRKWLPPCSIAPLRRGMVAALRD